MNQFTTKPKTRFLVIFPSQDVNQKFVKWMGALCNAVSSEHKLYIAAASKKNWRELEEYAIKQPIVEFCDKNSDMIVFVPVNIALQDLDWFDPNKHRLIAYGYEKKLPAEGLLLNLCTGLLWMDNLPESIQTSSFPTYQITTRAKTKWKKFFDSDWFKIPPRQTAIELYEIKRHYNQGIRSIKQSYEERLDSLQSNYREEIKAWSQTALQKNLEAMKPVSTTSNSDIQTSSMSTTEKQLHAKEVYIKDLETRLSRYENQTLYVIWHQVKHLVNILLIRLPLAFGLLGYHIFNNYYHRYQSSKKQL